MSLIDHVHRTTTAPDRPVDRLVDADVVRDIRNGFIPAPAPAVQLRQQVVPDLLTTRGSTPLL